MLPLPLGLQASLQRLQTEKAYCPGGGRRNVRLKKAWCNGETACEGSSRSERGNGSSKNPGVLQPLSSRICGSRCHPKHRLDNSNPHTCRAAISNTHMHERRNCQHDPFPQRTSKHQKETRKKAHLHKSGSCECLSVAFIPAPVTAGSYGCLLTDPALFGLSPASPAPTTQRHYAVSLDHLPLPAPPSQSHLFTQKPLMGGANCLLHKNPSKNSRSNVPFQPHA